MMMPPTERVECEIIRPIVYGNWARQLPRPSENGHTHEWVVYVKPYYQEPLSRWIKKVHFKLHTDYHDNNRYIEEEPFEVRETGWGEFYVNMRIFFVDPNERPVTFSHYLALRAPEVRPNFFMKESYDEVIFNTPSKQMHDLLMMPYGPHDPALHFTDFAQKMAESEQELDDINTVAEKEAKALAEAIAEMGRECNELKKLLGGLGDDAEFADSGVQLNREIKEEAFDDGDDVMDTN